MAFRKNTAEAFAILHRIARDKQKESAGPGAPAAEASPTPAAGSASGANSPASGPPPAPVRERERVGKRLPREPLLKAPGSSSSSRKAAASRGEGARAVARKAVKRPRCPSPALIEWMQDGVAGAAGAAEAETPSLPRIIESAADPVVAPLESPAAGPAAPEAELLEQERGLLLAWEEGEDAAPASGRGPRRGIDPALAEGLSAVGSPPWEEGLAASPPAQRWLPAAPLLEGVAPAAAVASQVAAPGEGAHRAGPGDAGSEEAAGAARAAAGSASAVAVLDQGRGSSEAPDPAPDSLAPGERAAALRAAAASARGTVAWLLGRGLSEFFERRLEIKVATLLAGSIALVIVVTLVLTALRGPGAVDPFFLEARELPATAGLAPLPPPAPATAAAPVVEASVAKPGILADRRPAVWSPALDGKSVPEAAPSAPQGAGEPVPVVPPGPEAGPPEPAPASPEPQPALPAIPVSPEPSSPYVYSIQVRAKESLPAAERIHEYLETFGFKDAVMELDRTGAVGQDGRPVYTVFVGRYLSKAEADRDCDRLKRETREQPYRNRREFFQESLVIRRTRQP